MSGRNVEVLAAATRRRRESAEKAVQKALREARKTTGPITIAGIATAAGVSTDFIYRHSVLRPEVEALRRARSDASAGQASHPDIDAAASTLVRRLTQQLATTRQRHREQVAELRTALEAAHGELLQLRRQLHDKS